MKFENWTIDELFERCIDTEDGSVFMNSDEVAALRRKIAELRSAQPVSGGYKLVPVEPTSQVIAPFIKHCCENETWVRQAWREMLAAAPEGGSC